MVKRINIVYRWNPSLSLLIFVLMFHLTKIQALWPPHLRGCPSPAPGQCGQWSRWPQLPNYHHYFEMLGAVTSHRTFTPCQHIDSILCQHLQTSNRHGVKERERREVLKLSETNVILNPHVIAVLAKVRLLQLCPWWWLVPLWPPFAHG